MGDHGERVMLDGISSCLGAVEVMRLANLVEPSVSNDQAAAMLSAAFKESDDRTPHDIDYRDRSWKVDYLPAYTIDLMLDTVITLTLTGDAPPDLTVDHTDETGNIRIASVPMKIGKPMDFHLSVGAGKRQVLQLQSASKMAVGQGIA